MRYDLAADGTAGNGKVFADVTAEKEDGLPDGMKVDSQGNIYGPVPAESGYSHRMAGIWARSSHPRRRRIAAGATTVRRST